MPKKNDGNESLCEKSESPVCVGRDVESEISSISIKFGGFVSVPRVLLKRMNLAKYLNRHRNNKTGVKDGLTKYGPHSRRLAQKCCVNVIRDDLEKLLTALKSGQDSEDSDTDASSEMALVCNICNKRYNNEKKLQNHQKNKHIIYKNTKSPKRVSFSDHVIVHEVKEYHKCRKCPKIFEDYQLLKTHMKKKHRKRKCYICNYCDKSFADRMFFKVHIRLHCDVCGKLLPNRSTFLDHRKNVCKVYKLHKCKTCSLSFYRIMDVKDHSYEHGGECYVCDICKEQFDTKCGVAHHISYLHSKKRPTSLYETYKVGNERLYICNFCEESSVEKDQIEKHGENLPDLTNRAMTGYRDYYFCDQCMKHFKTETEMLNHKWTHFLNNFDAKSSPKSILKQYDNTIPNSIDLIESEKVDTHEPRISTKFNINNLPKLPKAIVQLERIQIKNKAITDDIATNIDSNIMDTVKEVTHDNIMHIDSNIMDSIDNTTDSMELDDDDLYIGNFLEVQYSNKNAKNPNKIHSRKTLLSKHQCQNCGKYFSSKYCLNRHISTRHRNYQNLRCNVCEETFVWPSLLQNHKCIRLNLPEMPFDDARPEIHFNNGVIDQIDDLEIESDNYANVIDFEIPAPAVEVRECDTTFVVDDVQSLGYKIVMQEVPIEF